MLNLDYLDSSLGYWLDDKRPLHASRFCNDTRILQPGECFLAIHTDRRDGNEFLGTAKDRGAACAFVDYPQTNIDIPQFVCKNTLHTLEKFVRIIRQKFRYPIVAVTGSMGKTSTKDLLSLLLGVENNKTLLNANNVLGILMTMACLDLSENHAVIEIGIDELGHMNERLQIVQPTDVVITGVCGVHVCTLGDEESIAREKCRSAEYVIKNHGKCIFPENLLRFNCFRSVQHSCIVPSTGASGRVHYSVAQNIPERMMMLSIDDMRYQLPIPYNMSDGMIDNLVLSASYALLSGISIDVLNERLVHWRPSYIRGSIIERGKCTFYADCYNANPGSFEDSLKNFDRLFPHDSRLFVIGCFTEDAVGEVCASENRKIGNELPLRPNDTVIALGEQTEAIQKGILENDPQFEYNFLQNPDNLAEIVKNFVGVIYLKGHHFYHLEQLIT